MFAKTLEDCVQEAAAWPEYRREHLLSRNRSQTLTCSPPLADGARWLDGKAVS